jgi:MFS family permease
MGSFGCCNLMVGMIIAVWLDWLAHLFSIRYRGMVMGISFFSAAVLSAGGSLAAGRLLALRPGVATYGLLYGAAGIIAALSMLCFWLIDDPAEREPDVIARPSLPLLLDRFRASLADRNFRAFLVGRVLSVAGFCMLPFVAVHYQSAAGGGLTAAAVVANGAALTLGTALAHLALGWLGDRRGHRAGILVGATAQVATLAAALALPGAWGCRLTYALAGVCASAGWLSHSNLVIESCPHDHRLAHISVANLVVGLPMLALPPLAGLAARAWGLRTLFAASLGFSVLSALWYVLRVRDPRDYSLLDRVPPSRCHSTR